MWNPKWWTIKEFADNVPVNVFHKEADEAADAAAGSGAINKDGDAVAEEEPCNLHVLARAVFHVPQGSKTGEGTVREEAAGNQNPVSEGKPASGTAAGYHEKGRTVLLITADDYYKLYVNGTFITQGPSPAYPGAYYYNRVDITDALLPGKNVIAVHLYYQGQINRVWNSGDRRFALAAEFEGGQAPHETLSWRYRCSDAYTGETTGYGTLYLEDFDGRRWEADWADTSYDDTAWEQMVEANWADYRLIPQPTRPLAVYEQAPERMEEYAPGHFLVDMGTELTGALLLTAKGKAGEKIEIRCAEEMEEGREDTVRYQMRCGCTYREIWTLAGGTSHNEPYDYKGFRYANIYMNPGIDLLSVKALVRHYPMDERLCTFSCSDPYLTKIFKICKNGVRYGTQEGYLDCPTREKGQYLGDAVITSKAQMFLSDDASMLGKCLDQFALTRTICPGLLAVAPGSFMQEIADFSLLFPLMVKHYYLYTGDAGALARYLPVIDGILEHFARYEHADGLLYQVADKWNIVDWPENLRDDYDFPLTRPLPGEGCHNVINALYIGAWKIRNELVEIRIREKERENLKYMEKPALSGKTDINSDGSANISGNVNPGSDYRANAGKVSDARSSQNNENITEMKQQLAAYKEEVEHKAASYIRAFYRKDKQLFADGAHTDHTALHSNTYALVYGLVPEEACSHVADWIYARGFSCGVMHAYFVLKALAAEGRYEQIYHLLVRDDIHSYRNMLSEGATTCFEAWGKEQKWNTSLCHPWASAPVSILIEDIAGIRPNPEAKGGYELHPHIPEEVEHFMLSLTFHGKRITVEK